MITKYQVSFPVKTSQKSASKDLKLARYFVLLSLQNFKDNNILTYFEGCHLRSCAAVAECLNAPVLKPNTWVQVSTWSSLSSNQDYIESSILIFFRLRQNCFEYFLFDARYDQKVSGFILCEDATKSTFLTP